MKLYQRRAALVAAFVLSISGCAQHGTEGAKLAKGEKLQITQSVWQEYQEYVRAGRSLGSDRQGAFGVAVVGTLGLGSLYTYRYCPRDFDGCYPGGPTAVSQVLDACRRDKIECLIFARNEDIQVPYEIVN